MWWKIKIIEIVAFSFFLNVNVINSKYKHTLYKLLQAQEKNM